MKMFMIRQKSKAGRAVWKSTTIMRRIMVLLICVCYFSSGYAQNKTITGTVTDEANEPIIGASVTVENTSLGTVTNIDGQFSLSIPANTAQLVVSFIGYQTQKVKIGSNNKINVVLKEDQLLLDEVVVVGYNSQSKATLTGAVSAIGTEKLMTTKSSNVQNMLTGKLPGVRVIQKTSEPGEFNNQFDIRGYDNPLIIVDGVERGNFERMDPNDIASISILKDASAAIYGVRSSNGVVLITTKKGEKGKPKLEYSMYYGLQIPAEVLKPVGAYQRMLLMNEKNMRSTGQGNLHPTPVYSDQQKEDVLSGKTPSHDWYDAVLRGSAPQQQHNISLRGGGDNVDYYVNFGYMQQEGFFKSKDMNYDRYNLRANINAKVSDRLKVSLRISGTMDERDRQFRDAWEIFSQLWRSVPTSEIYANNNPLYYQRPEGGILHAVAITEKDTEGYKNNKKKIFQSQGEVEYDIPGVKGLTAKAMFSFDYNNDDNTTYQTGFNTYEYEAVSDSYIAFPAGGDGGKNSISRGYSYGTARTWNAQLNYQNKFGDHDINTFVLYEERFTTGDNFNAKRFLRIPYPYLFVGESNNQQATANAVNDYANKGIVGKVSYGFKDRYLIDANFRYDGSSRFLPNKQWDFYYGFSGGWRISEESFIKDNLPFINNLKIRASWGRLGNDGSNLYQFLGGYSYPATDGNRENGYPREYLFASGATPTMTVRATPNLDISWTEIKTTNIGLDADLWNGLFGLTFEVFERTRTGLYATRGAELPGTFGSDMPQENLQGDKNMGIELELRHANRINDLTYNLNGNVALTRRKNLDRVQTPFGNSYAYWTGNKADRYNDIWWGVGKGGRYMTYDEIARSPIYVNVGTLPGDYYYEDWNGDGQIDDDDKHPIATTTDAEKSNLQDKRNYPLMNFALSGQLQYKGFDFDFMFQGAAMSYVAYGEQLAQPLAWDGNALDYLLDRWRPVDPNQNPYDPTTKWITGRYSYGATAPRNDSRFMIQSGAYLRLKTVTLGYTLPKHILSRYGVNNLRVYVNAYNLFTITGVQGVDPEKPQDLYGYMYPLNKTVNFGAAITF